MGNRPREAIFDKCQIICPDSDVKNIRFVWKSVLKHLWKSGSNWEKLYSAQKKKISFFVMAATNCIRHYYAWYICHSSFDMSQKNKIQHIIQLFTPKMQEWHAIFLCYCKWEFLKKNSCQKTLSLRLYVLQKSGNWWIFTKWEYF